MSGEEEILRRFSAIEQAREFYIVGKKVARVDSLEAVLGKPIYTGDLVTGDYVFVRAVRSPYPHAKIKKINPEKALNMKEILGVLTHADIPGENDAGSLISDRPLLAVDKVRHYGEAVALVIGSSIESVDEALAKVEVEYHPLPVVTNPIDALKPDAPKVQERGNLITHFKIRKGDVAKGFEKADIIVENTYRTQFMDGMPLETEVAYAIPEENGRITCISSMQNPFDVYNKVVKILGLPAEKIRVIQAATGGGFGPKSDETPIDVAAYACLAALKTRKPVLSVFTREESVTVQCKRHAFIIENKTAATEDGKLVAWKSTLYEDTGAYISKGHLVIARATFHCTGPYEVPNVWADGYCVLTNNTMAGSTRGFGAPQAHFAAEVQMDILAKKLRMDPVELRAKNILIPGSLTATSQKIDDSGLEVCFRKAVEESAWHQRRREYEEFNKRSMYVKRGIGIALLYHGNTLGPEGEDFANVHTRIERDGTVIIQTGLTEYGTGAITSLAIVTAETLGISLKNIRVERPDTSAVTSAGPTVASRTTVIGGQAALDAAKQLRSRLAEVAAQVLEAKPEDLEFKDNRIYIRDSPERGLDFKHVVEKCYEAGIGLEVEGYYIAPATKWDPETGQGEPYNQYTFGALVSEVEVDILTGMVKVLKMTAVYDAGKVINPLGLLAVIEGGSIMGLGHALTEELIHENGIVVTPNLHTYLIPTTAETPLNIQSIAVESPGRIGVFGAKAMGEIPVVLPMASITNALAHAIGVHINETPLKPERILKAIQQNV